MLNLSRRGAHGWRLGLAVAVFGFSPTLLAAQQVVESPEAAMLQVTSASEEATMHFWAGLDDFENIFFSRGAHHLNLAIELDPSLGLVQVFYGWGAPGLTQAERKATIGDGIAAMGEATTAEVAVAMAMKEWDANNTSAAKLFFGVAIDLVPGDAHVAFLNAWVTRQGAGNQQAGIIALRDVTERFPDFAPAFNLVGFELWRGGDQAGGMKAIRRYVELMPDHSNSHDSYAELLQWSGRFDEAITHYKRAIELDADYSAGYTGVAEAYQLMGNGEEAIKWLTVAIDHAASPQGALQTRRALANAYWINGDRKAAMEQLEMVAQGATTQEFNGIARLAHREMAVLDALGKGNDVTAHLEAAADSAGADTPAQYAWTATAYALSGNMDMAREAATMLDQAAYEAANWQSTAHVTNALILLEEDQVSEAMAELMLADPDDAMARALTARCYTQMGSKMAAMAFKHDVIHNKQLSFFNAITPLAFSQVEKL